MWTKTTEQMIPNPRVLPHEEMETALLAAAKGLEKLGTFNKTLKY